MNKVVEIKISGDYVLWLRFQGGEAKIIDFGPLIGKGVSAPLLDKNYFNQVQIDNGGGIEWPNGFDFCPNYLKEYISKSEQLV